MATTTHQARCGSDAIATRSAGNGTEQTVLVMRARASGRDTRSECERLAFGLIRGSPRTAPRPRIATVALRPDGVVDASATAPLWMTQKEGGRSPSRRRT